MGFGDFVWFILSEEDKTTTTSIEYWFRIIDLDNNGIITGYELEHFFEEQSQRLAFLNNELVINFENIVCQMVDLLKPETGIQFTLDNFFKQRNECGIFFNILTNLNKLVAYEQRDAYAIRSEKVDHPDYTEWERFVKP
jgi:serine/threonine-protein phosphatase 2A regulatory subunit B''